MRCGCGQSAYVPYGEIWECPSAASGSGTPTRSRPTSTGASCASSVATSRRHGRGPGHRRGGHRPQLCSSAASSSSSALMIVGVLVPALHAVLAAPGPQPGATTCRRGACTRNDLNTKQKGSLWPELTGSQPSDKEERNDSKSKVRYQPPGRHRHRCLHRGRAPGHPLGHRRGARDGRPLGGGRRGPRPVRRRRLQGRPLDAQGAGSRSTCSRSASAGRPPRSRSAARPPTRTSSWRAGASPSPTSPRASRPSTSGTASCARPPRRTSPTSRASSTRSPTSRSTRSP